jgi:DNA modification methylase
MATEVALKVLKELPAESWVLDPMSGSGTVLRAATAQGHNAIGFDVDPLAVLMSRVWTTPLSTELLRSAAADLALEAQALDDDIINLPWLDDDSETREFIEFWFGESQRRELRRLSYALFRRGEGDAITDALRVALSRIIVTKGRGASLAIDVSHSRPHRVYDKHDFEVVPALLKSVERIAERLEAQPPVANAAVQLGDARSLSSVATASVDAVITSPPYLNAIDYLRGHRLSLVWLGYQIGTLRAIRAASIGSERAPDVEADNSLVEELVSEIRGVSELTARIRRMIDRYALDLTAALSEFHRVLRPDRRAVIVIGNSSLRGVFVENDRLVASIAKRQGFTLHERSVRDLPESRRYLPPPTSGNTNLTKRMRTETVLTLIRP